MLPPLSGTPQFLDFLCYHCSHNIAVLSRGESKVLESVVEVARVAGKPRVLSTECIQPTLLRFGARYAVVENF